MQPLWCDSDPLWVLQVLQLASPYLERLHLLCCRPDHLRIAQAMTKLKWLRVDTVGFPWLRRPDASATPVQPELEWLCLDGISRDATRDLLLDFGKTLKSLAVQSSACDKDAANWLSGECQLHSAPLKRLLLVRPNSPAERRAHFLGNCKKQLLSIHSKLWVSNSYMQTCNYYMSRCAVAIEPLRKELKPSLTLPLDATRTLCPKCFLPCAPVNMNSATDKILSS